MDESIVIPKYRLTQGEMSSFYPRYMLRKVIVETFFATFACVGLMMLIDISKSTAAASLIFVFPVMLFTHVFKYGLQMVRNPKNALLFEDREQVLGAGGFTQTISGGITSYVPWQLIKVEDRLGFFLLHFGAGQFFMIPHRALGPELDQQLQMFFYQKGLLKPSK